VRPAMWSLGLNRILLDPLLLFSTTSTQLSWSFQEGDPRSDRLPWGFLEYWRHGIVHGWNAMGWLSGQSSPDRIYSSLRKKKYKWHSAHVLAPLLIGAAMIIAFGFWEAYGAKYPMFPARLKQAPRILGLTLVITFISGANFFSIIMFWPTQAFNVYGHDPVGVGIRGIPVGFSILTGAVIVLWCLSIFRGRNKELMIISSVCMTAGRFPSLLS
jgi:hypothetical protein